MQDPATLHKRFYPFLGGIYPLDQDAAEPANPETTFMTNRQPFNNDRPQPAREANMRFEHRQRSWVALRVQRWARLILPVAWLLAGATPVTAQSDGATGQERLADHCDVPENGVAQRTAIRVDEHKTLPLVGDADGDDLASIHLCHTGTQRLACT